jgi:outer membrane protein assembly factor BamA
MIPLVVAVAWPALCAWCQQQINSNTNSAYEGQKVTTLELDSNPKISPEPFQALVQQKAGEPYSGAQIEATIAALRRTGRFNKVELEVQTGTDGLHLTFRLEPAFYFGIFDFPGTAKTFSYARLLQTVDIPEQTPYQRDFIAKARENLGKFLTSAGYFEAQVEPEERVDEAHLLVDVVFRISLGMHAKIGEVQVQGPEAGEGDRLLHDSRSLRAAVTGASLKPGKPYTQKRVDSAIALIKRDLANHHHLASKVHAEEPRYNADTNRVDLAIGVEVGPIVKVRISGANLSPLPFPRERQMRKLLPIFSEGTVDPDLVEEGRRNLVDFFQSKGYFGVKITADLQKQSSDVNLTYNVDRGLRHRVESIAFRGNEHTDERQLIKQVVVKPHRIFSRGKFSDKLIRKSVAALAAFYKDLGYQDVKAEPEVVDRDRKIYITFRIIEGEQTLVDRLDITGNSYISSPELARKASLRLGPGQPFSPKALADDRAHIIAIYLDQGFPNTEFDSAITPLPNDPHRVLVTYQIAEKQQVHVKDAVVLGNKKTRPALIARTARETAQAPLSRKNLLAAESGLHDLGIFDWESVEPRQPITNQDSEDVLIKLHESGRNEIAYGFGLDIARRGGNVPSGTIALPGLPPITSGVPNFTAAEKTFVSPRGSITFTRYNIRGLAESASVSLLIARLDQRALATYSQPHFIGSNWSSLYSASIERTTENPTFAARLADGSWQLEKPLNKDKTRRIQLRYLFRRTILSELLIPGLVPPQDQHLRLSTLSATWIRDTRDKPLDASRGFYETFDFAVTPKGLGSSADFARFLGQSSYYRPFGKTVWANRITLGLAKAFNGSDVPTSEKFYSGGETTLRGFPINGAGPQRTVPACTNPSVPSTCVNLQVPEGGRQLFILNSELRFPLGIKEGLGAAVFYDGGNVYGHIGINNFIRDYTNTVGVGLRYRTPVGPIRFDVGRNLNPVAGVRATQYYITLGQAF